MVRKDVWNEFLTTYKLKDGRKGDAEFTDGYIKMASLIEGISVDDNKTNVKKWMVRVGRIRNNDNVPSCTAINHGEVPPRMTVEMERAKKKLNKEL